MEDGIARLVAANPPAIEDHQNDWALCTVLLVCTVRHLSINPRPDHWPVTVLSLAVERRWLFGQDTR
jgi:hypothetical protein